MIKISKMFFMALLLGIFVMIFPAEASADVSKESDVVWGSGGNFINSVEYSESRILMPILILIM